MRYYSDVLKALYVTEEELIAAEGEHKSKIEKEKQEREYDLENLKDYRDALNLCKETAEAAIKDYRTSYEEYSEAIRVYAKKYGTVPSEFRSAYFSVKF